MPLDVSAISLTAVEQSSLTHIALAADGLALWCGVETENGGGKVLLYGVADLVHQVRRVY